MMEWAALREIFFLTFGFESGFPCINTALHTIQGVVFDIPEKSKERALPVWDTQMKDIV